MAGRPITWTENKKKDAIKLIFEGIYIGKSVRSILDNADRNILPSWVTFNEWLKNDAELVKQYVRMCEERADIIFEEMFSIADDGTNDFITKKLQGEDVEVLNSEHIQRSRLRIDTRKWALSKMNPKKYGDKIQTEHSGEISTTPIKGITFDEK